MQPYKTFSGILHNMKINLSALARELGVHRNTLQWRIDPEYRKRQTARKRKRNEKLKADWIARKAFITELHRTCQSYIEQHRKRRDIQTALGYQKIGDVDIVTLAKHDVLNWWAIHYAPKEQVDALVRYRDSLRHYRRPDGAAHRVGGTQC